MDPGLPHSNHVDREGGEQSRVQFGTGKSVLSCNPIAAAPSEAMLPCGGCRVLSIPSCIAPNELFHPPALALVLHRAPAERERLREPCHPAADPGSIDCTSYPSAAFTNLGLPNPGANLFCAGFAPLGDGRLCVVGGTEEGGESGMKHTYLFNPGTGAGGREPGCRGTRCRRVAGIPR